MGEEGWRRWCYAGENKIQNFDSVPPVFVKFNAVRILNLQYFVQVRYWILFGFKVLFTCAGTALSCQYTASGNCRDPFKAFASASLLIDCVPLVRQGQGDPPVPRFPSIHPLPIQPSHTSVQCCTPSIKRRTIQQVRILSSIRPFEPL